MWRAHPLATVGFSDHRWTNQWTLIIPGDGYCILRYDGVGGEFVRYDAGYNPVEERSLTIDEFWWIFSHPEDLLMEGAL